MDAKERGEMQARIDAIRWYHEYDFGDGLKTKSGSPDHTDTHRRIWRFIERNFDRVDFRGKSVLDIGCWDGYWSFAAEKRGAASVLASDDLSQNWSVGQGVHLAKELLNSKIDIDLNLSIYDIAKSGRKFDITLCLGVFYHLHDPYYAFSQLRHCCHDDTVVLIEGNTAENIPADTAKIDFLDQQNEFFPSLGYLNQLLVANYLRPEFTDTMVPAHLEPGAPPPSPPGHVTLRWRFDTVVQALKGDAKRVAKQSAILNPALNLGSCARVCLRSSPIRGANEIHAYTPPFGLKAYETRFKSRSQK